MGASRRFDDEAGERKFDVEGIYLVEKVLKTRCDLRVQNIKCFMMKLLKFALTV